MIWAAKLLASALILHLLLIQPNHPAALAWSTLGLFALELPVILLGLLALGQSLAGRLFRMGVSLILVVLFVLKSADFISFNALSRGFNPVTDISLIDAFVRLMVGSLGAGLTMLAALAACLAIGLVAWLTWWATGFWMRLPKPPILAWAAGPAAVFCAVVSVFEIGDAMGRWDIPDQPPGTAFTARVGVERIQLITRTRTQLVEFQSAVANDPFADREDLFGRVDRDVILIFIESYGRTSFDTPLYADLHRETLARYQARLSAEGLAMRSGFLTAPTRGGQSWLSHATLTNGLWVDNQVSFAALLASGRQSLFHHAARAGFPTAAVMPQITLDWPEAERMGFDQVFPAEALGYRGLPMNWVTMPDQFTLIAMDRLVRDAGRSRPTFIQVALGSSHAPWVPVPQIVPWTEIEDGTIFNAVAQSGDPPEVVWRDRDRIRAQYRLALDYALQSVLEYAVLHAAAPPLLLVIGDHQAAEFVALDDRAEVPIHVVGPTELVERFQAIAPTNGLIPDALLSAFAMEDVRDVILQALSFERQAHVQR